MVSRTAIALATLLIAALTLGGCSDASLYGIGLDDPSPDRLALTGEVCTDEDVNRDFPVRVVLLVDQALGPVQAWDPALARLRALGELVNQQAGGSTSFAVAGFGPVARKLAPLDEPFTTNPGELDAAVAALGVPRGCQLDACRDLEGALELGRAIVEADLADNTAGQRLRTRYVMVLVVAGAPDGAPADWDAAETAFVDNVVDLREDVEEAGSLSFALHTVQLAAPDPNDPDPPGTLDATEDLLQQLAFVGGGSHQRFGVPDAIALDQLGLLEFEGALEAQALLVVNHSALPELEGVVRDSDGDGLADVDERDLGTDPGLIDSDADGLPDLVELLLARDPTLAEPPPQVCSTLELPWTDDDGDRLDSCSEALVGTDPSLPDSDGDTVPDGLELFRGTNHLRPDLREDGDGDGVDNGAELFGGTDPSSSDATAHLSQAVRYTIEPLGRLPTLSVSQPAGLPGAVPQQGEDGLQPGLGIVRLDRAANTLSWRAPNDEGFGSAVAVTAGTVVLEARGPDQALTLRVEPALLPPRDTEAQVRVSRVERDCLRWTARNIRLVEGDNDVIVYLSQRPSGARPDGPGLFRVASIPVTWDAEVGRIPAEPLLPVDDAEFVRLGE